MSPKPNSNFSMANFGAFLPKPGRDWHDQLRPSDEFQGQLTRAPLHETPAHGAKSDTVGLAVLLAGRTTTPAGGGEDLAHDFKPATIAANGSREAFWMAGLRGRSSKTASSSVVIASPPPSPRRRTTSP